MRHKIILIAWTIALTVLFYVTAHAKADDYALRGGAAVSNSGLDGSSKIFGLRHEADLFYGVSTAEEIGGFVDNGGAGRKGSVLGKLQLGITPGRPVGVFGKVFTGPCVISAPDSQLGSWYQWSTDFGLGIRDERTWIAVTYSHISNAGVKLPNHGRDALVMEMGFRL